MFCRYIGIRLTGKKVPERNIIGNVIRLPTTAADSTLLLIIPTSIPRDTKNSGPITKNGSIINLYSRCAPKSAAPTWVIRKNEIIPRTTYQITFEVSHSVLVRGVRDSCLNSFVFLYSLLMLTRLNIGLVRTETPTSPGMRKSMYLYDCDLILS